MLQPILIMKNIPNIDINHQQNTRRSDQIETINDNAKTTRPRIIWKVCQWLRVATQEIFDQGEKDLDCELFYLKLKRHNVSHYIYYLIQIIFTSC